MANDKDGYLAISNATTADRIPTNYKFTIYVTNTTNPPSTSHEQHAITQTTYNIDNTSGICFGDFHEDGFFFFCSLDRIPTFDNRNFLPSASKMPNPYTQAQFKGFCLDCGASHSVIGRLQFEAIKTEYKIQPHIKRNRARFNFADARYVASQSITIKMPTPTGDILLFDVAIIDALIALLVGLDAMIKHRLDLLYSQSMLANGLHDWYLPMEIKFSHSFVHPIINQYQTLFTRPELERLHLHFFHPSISKLLNLIHRALPNTASPDLRRTLDDIHEKCSTCQEL